MNVLLVKTSSMGDIIHTLPALTDAKARLPDIQFDWVVEQAFAEIPAWHGAVNQVYPVNMRNWLRHPFHGQTRKHWRAFKQTVKSQAYDLVIDAQGLVKSALIARLSKAPRHGLGIGSARDWLASITYHQRHTVSWKYHAVTRVRKLFAQIFQYPESDALPNYGLANLQPMAGSHSRPYIVFVHGTTWSSKHWPETYWLALAKLITAEGIDVLVPWGNAVERARAEAIAAQTNHVYVLPESTITEIAQVFVNAMGIVAVDTGLGHLACALHRPTISLYGATDPSLTGTLGIDQLHLKADFACAPCFSKECKLKKQTLINPPCYEQISPQKVWDKLQEQLQGRFG